MTYPKCFYNHSFGGWKEGCGTILKVGGELGGGSENLMVEFTNYAIDSMSSNSMKSANPDSGIHQEDYVKTIDASGNNPSCNQGGNMIVYALQGNMIGRNDKNGPAGKGYKGDEMYTLNTIDRHAIVEPVNLRVRKITETECLKLMGLPIDWFDDSGLPKTKKYEKCGNGLVTGEGSYWWYMWNNIYRLLGKESPTLFSQFNGVGMTEYVTEQLGFRTLYTSEIDESANKVYRALQGRGVLHITSNLGDIMKVKGSEIVPCDVIFSSSPCQSFSSAGKGLGEQGESGLVWETIRTAEEMLEATNGQYPKIVATENVAGELSHKDFLKRFLEKLDSMGYAIDINLHNSLDYNVAQSRLRVSIVAAKKDFCVGNEFEEHRHNRVKKTLKSMNANIELCSGIATFPHEPQENELCSFIDSGVSEDYDLSKKACVGILRRSFQRGKVLPAILAYALVAQSEELYYESEYDSAKGKVDGKEFRKWYDEIISKGFEKMELPVCLDNHPTDSRINIMGENTPTIAARWGTGGNNTALILETINDTGGGEQYNAQQNRVVASREGVRCFGGSHGDKRENECCPTITVGHSKSSSDMVLIVEMERMI